MNGRRVGLLYHPLVPESQQLARRLVEVVEAAGLEPWVESAWAREEIVASADSCGLIVTMGGDGTILRVARATLPSRRDPADEQETPPLLTVNFGRLGFLAELEAEQAPDALRRVLEGESFWLEPRHLLHAAISRGDSVIHRHLALNDVVLARGDGPHAIRVHVAVDGADALRYTADGVIVASPTGSTAYAQGAGGPLVAPGVQGMLLVPVAPHLTVARALVLPPTSRVTLRASSRRAVVAAFDGQIQHDFGAEDRLHVTHSRSVARFVRLGPRSYFYEGLERRLMRERAETG